MDLESFSTKKKLVLKSRNKYRLASLVVSRVPNGDWSFFSFHFLLFIYFYLPIAIIVIIGSINNIIRNSPQRKFNKNKIVNQSITSSNNNMAGINYTWCLFSVPLTYNLVSLPVPPFVFFQPRLLSCKACT